jgi:hypothetical protein
MPSACCITSIRRLPASPELAPASIDSSTAASVMLASTTLLFCTRLSDCRKC